MHDGLGGGPEHIAELQVYGRFSCLGVAEGEIALAADLAYDVERCSFPFSYPAQLFGVGFLHHQSHALLALIADDFLVREGGVAYGQLGDVDVAADLLDQLRETVQVSAGAVVVYRDDGVVILLGYRADGVVDPLLHFGVGPLYGVQLNRIGIFSCGDGGYCSSAHADAVVVTAHEDDVVSLRGAVLGGVGLLGVAHSSGEHHDLVIAVLALGAVGILLGVL